MSAEEVTSPDAATAELEAEFNPIILCGLGNLGNTCYFNSGMQCLLNTRELVTALRWCGSVTRRQMEANGALMRLPRSAEDFYHQFIATMNEMDRSGALHIQPGGLLKHLANVNPQFEGWSQQDTPEMVNTTLAALEDATAIPMQTKVILERTGLSTDSSDVDDQTISKIRDPSSRRSARVLHFMEEVNRENARVDGTGNYVPPRLFRSAPQDVFKGYLLNETQCSKCKYVSRVVDSFTSLSVAMPTYAQRSAWAKAHPKPQSEMKAKKKRCWNPFAAIASCFVGLLRACGCWDDSGSSELGPLTLEECLSIHFNETHLKGTNKYKCDVCKSKVDATHRTSILELPDVLIVHLKRFEYGHYWTSKKSEHVQFPMNWSPSYHPSDSRDERNATGAEVAPAAAQTSTTPTNTSTTSSPTLNRRTASEFSEPIPTSDASGDQSPKKKQQQEQEHSYHQHKGLDMAPFCTGAGIPPPQISTYSLTGVVNHHGSYSGGHYTNYVHKGEHGWVLCNDHRVVTVKASEVAASQGYLLFYKKQRAEVEPLELTNLRTKARQYLSGALVPGDNQRTFFVSRLWLHRLATFTEPGLMLNNMCYCDDINRQRCLAYGDKVPASEFPEANGARHFHCSTEWFYIPVSEGDYGEFQSMFGGGPAIDDDLFANACKREFKWRQALAKSMVGRDTRQE